MKILLWKRMKIIILSLRKSLTQLSIKMKQFSLLSLFQSTDSIYNLFVQKGITKQFLRINNFFHFIRILQKLSQNYLFKTHQQIPMKSKTSIPSSKSLLTLDTKKMISLKCKQDHFSYNKQLSVHKNYSSYTSAYHEINPKSIVERLEAEKYKNKLAPVSLDQGLFKRSLHQSTIHFSNNKRIQLPSINIGSTYNQSFHEKSNEKIVKGKQQIGFFIKMPWHDNPTSNYKKSFDASTIEVSQSLQIGKPQQDHIKLIKTPFKANSNYEEFFNNSLKKNIVHQNCSQCIKSKDHLTRVNFPLKGQSEYKSSFDKSQDKENRPSSRSIDSKKKISLLPKIKPVRIYNKEDSKDILKKSIKMQKTQSSPAEQTLKSAIEHKKLKSRFFG